MGSRTFRAGSAALTALLMLSACATAPSPSPEQAPEAVAATPTPQPRPAPAPVLQTMAIDNPNTAAPMVPEPGAIAVYSRPTPAARLVANLTGTPPTCEPEPVSNDSGTWCFIKTGRIQGWVRQDSLTR